MRYIVFLMCFLFSASAFGAVESPRLDLKLLPLKAGQEVRVDWFSFAPMQGKMFDLARDTYVNGYYRSNGTYIKPHHRSAPDGDPYNNFSYPGNLNPYTGRVAPGDPSTYLRRHEPSSSGSGLGRQSRPRGDFGSSGFRIPSYGLWGDE